MALELPARDPALEHERVQGHARETEADAVEHGDEAHGFDVHTRLLLDLLHRHLCRGVSDVGPARGVQPHAEVGPLDEQDLALVVADDGADGDLRCDVAGHALAYRLQPLLDEDLGLQLVAGRHPDVGGHLQHLLEPLTLVEALGEPEPGPGDGRQRLAPAQQVLRRGDGRLLLHAPEVDLRAQHVDGTRLGEQVAREDVEQLAVEPGGQPRGVVVPVQQVESRRRVAHQVVVDPVVPHQVVGPHPREHAAHLLALQHALHARGALGGDHRLGRGEETELRLVAHVEHRHHQRGGVHDAAAARRQVAHQRGHRHRAGAGAVQVHVVAAGDLADRVDGLDQRGDVGVHVPVALRRGRVAPAHHEHLHALAHQVLDDAAARRQVEDVELVDLRRHDELRPRVHRLGGGRVLDQLEHRVAEHHRAGRQRQVAAQLEGARVHLRGHAAVVREVADHVAQAGHQAAAAGLDHALQCARVADQRVRRRERLRPQRHHELCALAVLRVERRAVHQRGERLRPGEIGLRRAPVEGVRLPRLVGEALVARRGRQLRLARDHGDELAGEGGFLLQHEHRVGGGLAREPTHRGHEVARGRLHHATISKALATSAGLWVPSTSTVFSVVSSVRPPSFASADSSLMRVRMRAPDFTGEMKRSRSSP